MSLTRRNFLELSSAAAILAGWGGPLGRNWGRVEAGEAVVRASDEVYHFLNRISYGVTDKDILRCNELGIEAYLDEQLNPEKIKSKGRVKLSSVLKMDRVKAAKQKDAGG